jgi:transcriptional regulator with XRE-family HTH domain
MGRPKRSDADREAMVRIGQHLRYVREAWGRSQTEIATITGIHQTTWSLYERGLRLPDQFAVERIAAKLRLDISYIWNGDLSGLEREVAIRIAASHPELVAPLGKASRKDTERR